MACSIPSPCNPVGFPFRNAGLFEITLWRSLTSVWCSLLALVGCSTRTKDPHTLLSVLQRYRTLAVPSFEPDTLISRCDNGPPRPPKKSNHYRRRSRRIDGS